MTEPSLHFMLLAALGLVPGTAIQSAPSPATPISLGEANQSGRQALRASTALVEQFQSENAFWRQFAIGQEIVERRDPRVLPILAAWFHPRIGMSEETSRSFLRDLETRAGFNVIVDILTNIYSDRPRGVIAGGNWTLRAQIRSDRYYAAHLLGDLPAIRERSRFSSRC